MIHHTCNDCQRGFTATSRDEALQDLEEIRHKDEDELEEKLEDAVRDNVVAYAKYCPYCSGTNVEAI